MKLKKKKNSMISLSDFINESIINESEYSQLLKEIENLTHAKNASEFNATFEVIESILKQIDQTVEFAGKMIANLDPKAFYCVAARYENLRGDDPKYHGDTLGSISLGPGSGKVAHITYNSNLGGKLDKTGGAFVVVNGWGGGYKKDVFANAEMENSIRCLGPSKDVKTFTNDILKLVIK